MSNNIGEISYTVSLELEQLLIGSKKVSSAMDDLGKAGDKGAKSIDNLDKLLVESRKRFEELEKNSGIASDRLKELSISSETTKNKLKDLLLELADTREEFYQLATTSGASSEKIKELALKFNQTSAAIKTAQNDLATMNTRMSQAAGAVKQASGAMGNMRGVAGQLGYQIQDIAVQLQMGQNAFMVFAQQGSQMLSILGPMGAVAGAAVAIGGAIAGALLPNLFDSTDASKALTQAQKELGEVITKTDDNILVLSEKIAKLAKENEGIARSKIAVAMIDAKNALKAAGDASSEALNKLTPFFNAIDSDSVINAVKNIRKFSREGESLSSTLQRVNNSIYGSNSAINDFTNTARTFSASLSISQTEAQELLGLWAEMEKTKSPESIQNLATYLNVLSERYGNTNETLTKLTREINENSGAAFDAEKAIEMLKAALDDLAGAAKASESGLAGNIAKMDQIAEAAKRSADTIAMTERQKAKYLATALAVTDADKEHLEKVVIPSIDASFDKIEAYKKEQEALKEREQADKKAKNAAEAAAKKEANEKARVVEQLAQLAQRYEIATLRQKGFTLEAAKMETVMQLGAAATEEQKKQAEQLAEKIYNVTTAMSNFDSVMSKAKPAYQLDIDFAKDTQSLDEGIAAYKAKIAEAEQEIAAIRAASGVNPLSVNSEQQIAELTAAKETYLASIMEAEEARKILEDEYREKRIAAEWEAWKRSSEGAAILGNALDAMAGSGSGAIAGLLSGTMSLKDAFRSVANTVFNSVISSIVEMGMAQVRQMMIGQAMAKATTAAQTAQAAALSAAFATPAALVSLATQGANAIPAKAGIATTIASTKALAITGRKNGGVMSANQMYRVGENNQPEIYQAKNGMQYMIPGNSGRMFSNKEVSKRNGGGSSSQTITINMTNHFESKDQSNDHSEWTSELVDKIRGMIQYELREARRDGNAGAF